MNNEKVLNRFLLAISFVTLITFVFLFQRLNVAPEGSRLFLKIIYFFTLYGFVICLVAGLVLSTILVFKEEYQLVWLFELLNAVAFVFILLGLLAMATTPAVTVLPGYACLVLMMMVLNLFNLSYRLILKMKSFSSHWKILVEKEVDSIRDVFDEESQEEFLEIKRKKDAFDTCQAKLQENEDNISVEKKANATKASSTKPKASKKSTSTTKTI